ncbi:hypothetical protein MAR_035152 [Mya arenaria]|uniref:Receptor ligand binding region domain-containing protein n=1 Tax=Mya arenaria TaxID=6604 RepID=A0ABY7ESA3_MYAAR|nr:hypothetical protein MAR_035152 [Mya arenaria]
MSVHLNAIESANVKKIVLQGNVYIEGVFTVYENEAGGCGKTLPFSVQHIEAVTWQLRKLNNRVAVLGPENSEEAEVVSRLLGALPASVRPLHISFSADGDVFTDRVAFNNFFRVIPPETATVESVAKFLSEMFWTYVAVFHDNSTQSLSRLEYLKELVMSNGIITCFPRVFVRNGEALANVEDDLKGIYEADKRINGVLILGDVELWQTVSAAIDSKVASTNSSYERPVVLFITDTYLSLQATEDPSVSEKGLYIASPRTIEVTPFTEGWTELLTNSTNGTSYVHTMMEQHHAAQCKAVVSEVCRAKALKLFPPSVHSPYAILATLLISNALEYSTQTKEYIFRSGNIRQYTTNGTEHIYPDVLRPECPDGRQCTECPMRESPPIDVTEGDMYIVGIVPVHTTSGNALQCGNVKQGGVDVAESIKATVLEAKNNPSQYLEADNCFRVTPDQRCFKVETWSPFAAIGVETLLKGNGNTSTICEEYLRQPEVLMKHVLKQKFAVSGTSLKQVYNVTSHDGLIDLNTYQIKKDDKGVYYDQLEEGWVYAFRESTCDKIDNPECSICFKDPTTTPSPPPADNSKQSYMTATFVTASFCCMLVMVLIITMCKVVQGRRKRAARRQIYLTPTMGDDGYLSTNDVQRMSSVGDFPGGIFNKDVNISDESNNTPPQGHASNTSLNNLNNSCNPPPPYLGPAQQNKYV